MGSTPSSAPAVELVAITKAFPGVLANDHVDLEVRRGEVHCLLGENGAGKSTLIAILSGMQRPDSGQIRIDGKDVRIDSPRAALNYGIGTVYQHSTLIPSLTVLENLMLGGDRRLRLDTVGARARLDELASLLGVEIDPTATAGDLALGQQQQVEIIKALWRGSRVLVLDEPTSMLTPQGVVELQRVLDRLKGHGLALVFITHKLHEALAVGDRVTLLRGGRRVRHLDAEELRSASAEEIKQVIVGAMFGGDTGAVGEVAELQTEREGRGDKRERGTEVALELSSVSARGEGADITEVSLELREGEILGIAGMDGHGQRGLAEVVAGQRPVSGGEIRFYGTRVNRLDVGARQRRGLRYVTDDRLGEGTVGSLSVALNLFLKRVGQSPYWRWGRIDRRAVDRDAARMVETFDVRTPGIATRIGTLSGGNIQKVLLGRELSFDPKVVVFHKPSYGLDVRTVHAVREMIRELAAGGGAALVISTDLDELVELSDRIGVLSHGRLAGTVPNGPDAAERVGELMIGETAPSGGGSVAEVAS